MKTEDMSIVALNDDESRTKYPLIEKPAGRITYEHYLVERFYRDVYIGTAERNYYVDRYHELCLCVHYNRRIPCKYQFDGRYQFFVTKKRMCLDIYWNLGNISDESTVLEKYDSIEEAKGSCYYTDFCEIKKQLDDHVKWKQSLCRETDEYYEISGIGSTCAKVGGSEYTVYETPVAERREMAQFYKNNKTEKWEWMSITLEPIQEMMHFFKDFDEIDKEELHLRRFYNLDNYRMDACYQNAFIEARRGFGVITDFLNRGKIGE